MARDDNRGRTSNGGTFVIRDGSNENDKEGNLCGQVSISAQNMSSGENPPTEAKDSE